MNRQGHLFFWLGLVVAQMVAQVAANGQGPEVVRQGSYWVGTSTGVAGSPASGRVVVKTHGSVLVRKVFLAVVSALIAKTAWDAMRGFW